MLVVLLHQINQLGADVTNRRAFVSHLAHTHIRRYRYVLIAVLQDMVVAVQLTSNARQIWDNGRNLTQVQTIDTQRDVLQHG